MGLAERNWEKENRVAGRGKGDEDEKAGELKGGREERERVAIVDCNQ
jgi:hypothetical protein